jgi:hypothetical protein
MSTESLFATATRFFQETAAGNGTATGEVIELPLTGAAAARRVIAWEQQTTPFRLNNQRAPIHQVYELRTSHEVNLWLAAWLLERHMTLDAGVYYLDREAPEPTFAMQLQSEDGDLIDFKGMALVELQISVSARRVVTMECTWSALSRGTGTALEAVTAVYETEMVPSTGAAVAIVEGLLAADSRTDVIDCHSAELFFSRKDLAAVNYEADGQPGAYNSGAWRVVGEAMVPASALTEVGQGRIVGGWALLLGLDGADLDFRVNTATGYVVQDPIKADDFREQTILLEAAGDSRGSLIELRDNQ